MVHCGGLNFSRVGAGRASSRDKDGHLAMVRSVFLSQGGAMSPATATSNKREGDGMVESTSGRQKEKCSVMSVSLELELRTVREENQSLTVAVDEYKVRMNNLGRKGGRAGTERSGVTARPGAVEARV